ncbi:hypothetical protein AKJ57_03420 [candidate division MSBL1 archaeon SCGC-AAA259A05]|uniref:Uncharacterized protein n=1 Tax=candidate division MSBL1 archaeon SCGC-AAA259A05 TaxID=1698259 RepID=A0A133U9K3_9EURY|nr:hypothetical protein AKJ57_03420 [candidate division MSBL1 archaeon SCGC-AAA259A05]
MEIKLTKGEKVAGCFFTTGLFLVTLGLGLWMASIPLITFSLLGSAAWLPVTFTKYSSYRSAREEVGGEDLSGSAKDTLRKEKEETEELRGEVEKLRSGLDSLRATLAEKGFPAREEGENPPNLLDSIQKSRSHMKKLKIVRPFTVPRSQKES